jgi:hypothetical protein
MGRLPAVTLTTRVEPRSQTSDKVGSTKLLLQSYVQSASVAPFALSVFVDDKGRSVARRGLNLYRQITRDQKRQNPVEKNTASFCPETLNISSSLKVRKSESTVSTSVYFSNHNQW